MKKKGKKEGMKHIIFPDYLYTHHISLIILYFFGSIENLPQFYQIVEVCAVVGALKRVVEHMGRAVVKLLQLLLTDRALIL